MSERRPLSADEWDAARRRWEGDARDGFGWLAAEIKAAWGVDISRQAVAQMAGKKAWKKGAETTATLRELFHAEQVATAHHAAAPGSQLPALPVDLAPGEKPPGYVGVGRPALYRPEYDDLIVSYFDRQPSRQVRTEYPGGSCKIHLVAEEPPMLAGFAKSIGVGLATVNRWATEVRLDGKPRYPGFAEAYARARDLQEALLVQGAAVGVYEPRVIQFALKNLHGWRDQPAMAQDDFAPPSIEEVERDYISNMDASRARMLAVYEEREALKREV